MEYTEIKQNIIDMFLTPAFRWTSISVKGMIIYTIKKLSWFPVEYNEAAETLNFNLGNNVIIPIKIIWEQKDNKYILKQFV